MKMTVLMASGNREVIEVLPPSGQTDEETLEDVTAKWLHALTCQRDVHLMRFKCYPSGAWMIVAPDAIHGFSLKVEVLQ